MEELFAGGRIIDAILVMVAVEAAALFAWLSRQGRVRLAWALLPNLASGACLMLALRIALAGGGWWGWIGLCLAGSLAAHLADLIVRIRRGPSQDPGPGSIRLSAGGTRRGGDGAS